VSLLFFSGCNNPSSTNHTGKKELIYASTKDIRNINPHLYGGEMSAQNMVFESLVINTPEGVKPWLAKSWDIKDEGKTYIFHLRNDVKFSDGTPFNAQAVKENIDAVLDNHARHAWLELVNEISGSEVIDEFTYKLTLKHPYYPTLTELAMTRPFRFIAPQSFIDGGTKNGVKNYIGTGPWVLSEHEKNAYALFKANPTYWAEKPKLESIKWRVMPDHQTILLALQKGEIDLIFGADGDMINLDAFNVLQKDGKYTTLLSQPTASRAILINTKQPITHDNKVREALQYTIQKEAIVAGILNNSETIAKTLFAPTTPYCNVVLNAKEYNLEKAKALLDEAGWLPDTKTGYRVKDGVTLSLRLYFNINNAQEKTISEYIQSNLKAVGIELKIIGEEKQAYLDRQKNGDFDLQYSLSWGLPYDPQSYISSWRMAAHGDYQAQLGLEKKAWLDETIQAILIEPDTLKRQAMYEEILRYIHDENVYIPLSYSRTKAVFTPNLKGVSFNPSQYEIAFEKMFF
jgi:nickel transport system substrate-binding protein